MNDDDEGKMEGQDTSMELNTAQHVTQGEYYVDLWGTHARLGTAVAAERGPGRGVEAEAWVPWSTPPQPHSLR